MKLPFPIIFAFFFCCCAIVVSSVRGDPNDPENDQHRKSHPQALNPNDDAQSQPCLLDNERSSFYVSIPESAPKGSVLGTLPFSGRSAGQNIQLKIVRGNEYVQLNPQNNTQLVLRKEMDREQQGSSRFEATIECIPTATNRTEANIKEGLSLNISVYVTVTDVNDNAPQFPRGGQFSISIPEELPEGTPIKLEFRATDRDQNGPNSHIRYRIVRPAANSEGRRRGSGVEDTSTNSDYDVPPFKATNSYSDFDGDPSSTLTIPEPYRPEIVVSGRIDFERVPKFTVFIEAEDQGTPRLRTLARLEVNVIDVDDQNPVFSAPIYTSKKNIGHQLVIEPGPIRAWDVDRSFNETIIYSIDGDHSVNYAIDELTGLVSLLADQLVPANLVIRAWQMNRPERNATSVLLVEPQNPNKQQSSEHILLKIPSDLAADTMLIELGKNGTFEVLSDPQMPESIVYIDNSTGWLRLARQLPSGEYNVNVSVKPLVDHDPPPPSSLNVHSIQLRLLVSDRCFGSNLGPKFGKGLYEFELNWTEGEEHEEGQWTVVGQIVANQRTGNNESCDATNGSIVYSLLNGNSYFDIDPFNGSLRLRPIIRQQFGTDKTVSAPPAELPSELVVMAEDAQGRRNFARCIVRLPIGKHSTDQSPSLIGDLSPALPLGLLCFLLLISNCAVLSLWLGKRRFGAIYDQMAYRYDSMGLSNKYGTKGSSNSGGKVNWMLNRSLEGDPSVKVNAICGRGSQ